MIKIFLNFDFYGAGNIGDDLMLDGFLNEMKSAEAETDYYCSIPRNYYSQQLRFPGINFIPNEDRSKTATLCDIWIGVGDTPVQVKSGDWFLEHLLRDSELKKKSRAKYYFIGVGAESEAIAQKDNYKIVLDDIDHLWTRDKATTEILTNISHEISGKITTSSDLANISLRNIFGNTESKKKTKIDLGMCYYDENAEPDNLKAIKLFLQELNRKNKKVLMFGNEVRMKGRYEYKLYMNMFTKIERILGGIKYFQPDYYNLNNISELVRHYNECETIMTSRYHSLLTAAWAGCKIVALERSSKVSALAKELGIIEVKKPFTAEKLMQAYIDSVFTDKNIIDRLYKSAVNSTTSLKKSIFNKNS